MVHRSGPFSVDDPMRILLRQWYSIIVVFMDSHLFDFIDSSLQKLSEFDFIDP